MPTLVQAVKATIPPAHLATPLSRVAIYPYFTIAKSRRMGAAMTLLDSTAVADQHSREVHHVGEIESRPLAEILAWTDSDHPLERSIGVAALNSCLPLETLTFHDGNALDLALRLGTGKHVVVVGHFPRLGELRAAARSLAILEKKPLDGDLPAEAAPEIIPHADVVAITGVTFLNDTLEGLLALKRPGAIVIVLGPTVPLSPALLDRGVDIIGGAWIDDEPRVEAILRHGGMPRRGKGMRYVLLARNPALVEGCPRIEPPRVAGA